MKTITNIYKKNNGNGTFTYTDNNGRVLIAASKRDYEYFSVAHFGNWAFGKYTTCAKALRDYQRAAEFALKDIIERRAHYLKHWGEELLDKNTEEYRAFYESAKAAKVIKIETI